MSLYHSPLGLFDFQALGVGRCYVQPDNLAVWGTGIGKTHLAMGTGAVLIEDDLIDLMFVTAEVNKVRDWLEDVARFTDLSVDLYHGTTRRREKLRDNPPQVLVSTYETARNDAAVKGRTKRSDMMPGPLAHALGAKRVLFVYDECTRLKNRSSGVYRAHEVMVRHARKADPDHTRVLGLTATPIETSPEDMFNASRIVTPVGLSVAEFETNYIAKRDIFGKPIAFKNLSDRDPVREEGVPTFRSKLGGALSIKHKSDPDVRDQFPKQVEEFETVRLDDNHLAMYRAVRDAFYELQPTPNEERQLFVILRLLAGHPMALARSKSQFAQAVVDKVGVETLAGLGCAKLDRLLTYLNSVVKEQGNKAIVFTYFGQAILPLLHETIRLRGFEVVINHGGMQPEQRQASINALRHGDAEIFLSSDAGSRGLNLPEATYVSNYELPLTFANYRQRSDRVHRIDSVAETVVTNSMIASGTVEDAIAYMMLRRNRWHDVLLTDDDDEGAHLSAEDRRELITFARSRLKDAA